MSCPSVDAKAIELLFLPFEAFGWIEDATVSEN